MYILKYVGSDASEAPMIHVQVADNRLVRLILPPDVTSPVLEGPGTALVLLSDGQSDVRITVQARSNGGSLDAKLQLERLQTGTGGAPSATRARQSAPASDFGFRLVGHVALLGDVVRPGGGWIGGPEAPAPIEGLEVDWPNASGLMLEYQVVARGADRWSDWIRPGQFVGSKGRSLPLSGVRFRLSGPESPGHTLKAAALFLGSAVIEQSGQVIELRSGALHDPLVGLMLDIVAADAGKSAPDPSRLGTPPSTGERKGRVRVFRAGVEQRLG